MTENETEAKNLPTALEIRFEEGLRGRVALQSGKVNALANGKIDRDSVYQLGRMPEDFSRYVINDGQRDVAYLTRGEQQWVVHLIGEDGTEKQHRVERTATKKPRRAGSKMPPATDNGPDLFSAVTKAAQMVWPDLKATSRGTTSNKRTPLREQLEAKNAQIMAVLQALADDQGLTVEEIAANIGVEVPTMPESKETPADQEEPKTKSAKK